jgi:polar amino acid transport system substrate-binding protein
MLRYLMGSIMIAAGFAAAGVSYAQDKTAHVATLDWPPYTGSELPSGGATSEVVRDAFAKAGLQADIVFRPWKRAIDMASKGSDDVVAYFPGYHCKHQDGFIASEPIGNGPLGFAEHIEAPISWDSIDSIGEQNLKIGTSLGYANTDEFDAKVKSGVIHVIPANNELPNLKKLIRKRVDAVVIDKFTLEYLKATEPSLLNGRENLRFNAKPLEDKTLYLCFRNDEVGRAMRETFNAGLAKIDVNVIVDNYFSTAFSQ